MWGTETKDEEVGAVKRPAQWASAPFGVQDAMGVLMGASWGV